MNEELIEVGDVYVVDDDVFVVLESKDGNLAWLGPSGAVLRRDSCLRRNYAYGKWL